MEKINNNIKLSNDNQLNNEILQYDRLYKLYSETPKQLNKIYVINEMRKKAEYILNLSKIKTSANENM